LLKGCGPTRFRNPTILLHKVNTGLTTELLQQ
jgi:hypothetical protein